MESTIWGIDLGGTKIECAVLQSGSYEVLKRTRIPTEQEHGYEHILAQIKKLVDIVSEDIGYSPSQLGIATPGAIDGRSGLLKNSNTVCLNGKPIKEDLINILGMPVSVANDANCFALAETKMGAVRDEYPSASVVFGIIMGTGVGGGLVVDGKIVNGLHGIGGEWGHTFLDNVGGDCYCGRVGCVERIISGPSLERYYTELTGEQVNLKTILAKKDDLADMVIERLVTFFGRGFSNIINIIDPEAVVIGGGLGNIDALYTRGVEELSKNIFNKELNTPFLKPKLGDSAGVFGAAMLVD